MELYLSKIVDPLKSPCLKTVHRKSSELCDFLVLRPVVLKIAYSTQLIDSFPLTYGMRSCNLEQMLIPLEVHNKAQLSEIYLSFQPKN